MVCTCILDREEIVVFLEKVLVKLKKIKRDLISHYFHYFVFSQGHFRIIYNCGRPGIKISFLVAQSPNFFLFEDTYTRHHVRVHHG